jgi:hypothetical protein
MSGFNDAPDTLISIAHKSSGNNCSAFPAAIVLECERTVALCDTNQRKVVFPLDINGPAVNVGTFIADSHGASGIASRAHRQAFARIAQKKPAERAKTDAPAEEKTRAKIVSGSLERLSKR